MRSVDGVLRVDKPQGWTSHDVCAFVRKQFHLAKVGHAGTLDPLATGLLVLLLGKGTKLSVPLSSCDKEYYGAMELGLKTDSHDKEGHVLGTAPWEGVSLESVRETAKQFTGEILQTPPMVSALKHQGTRLYQLARRGLTVSRAPRKIIVHRLEIEKKEGPLVYFSACVSKGTYLRTLVHDLGEALGCFAALSQLRRLRSGYFELKDSVTIDELRALTLDDLSAKVVPCHLAIAYASHHRP